MIEETGVVSKVDGVMARVIVQKRGACEGCAASGVCESSEDGMEIEALNPVQAKTGQTVRLSIKPQTYLKGSLLVYGIPLVSFIAGAIMGKELGENYIKGFSSDFIAAIVGFLALVLSLLVVKAWSRKVEKEVEYKPVIEEIIENTGGS